MLLVSYCKVSNIGTCFVTGRTKVESDLSSRVFMLLGTTLLV
jgi:hypothetical protein